VNFRALISAAVLMAGSLFFGTKARSHTYSLVIGLDGLAPYGLGAGSAPNLHSLIDGSWAGPEADYRGSLSNHAFAGGILGTSTQQATSSGPGWSSILTGVWKDKHGVINNTFSGSQYASWPAYLKTLESQVANIRTAGIVTWSPITTNIFAPDGVNPNLDFAQGTNSDSTTTAVTVSQISLLPASSPGALFVQLDDIDIAGHSSGMYSSNYLGQVADVDSQVGSMLAAIRNRASFPNENWQIFIVSDHGHVGSGGHGGQSTMERTIPVIVSSKSTVQGLVPADARQPAMVDVAATVLNHFGVTIPTGQVGLPLGSQVIDLSSRSSLLSGLVSHLKFEGSVEGSYGVDGGTAFGNVQYADGRFVQAGLVAAYGSGYVRLDRDLGAEFGLATDFAMSLWVKYDSISGDPAFFSNKNWNSGANTGINFALQTVGGGSLDLNTRASGGVRRDIEPFRGVGPGEWHHLLINVDRDGQTLLYIDGYLFGEVSQTSQGSFDGSFQWNFFNDGTGAYTQGSAVGLMLDEFGAWNRLLSRDEIAYLANSPISPFAEVVGSFVDHLGYSGAGTSIDAGKSLAQEGSGPTQLGYEHLINSVGGIRGLILDIQRLGNPGGLSAADFMFQISPQGVFEESAHPPSAWSSAPVPLSVTVTPGSPDRVRLQWAEHAIENRWLRLTVSANANTGLAIPRTFYLGHLCGETDAQGTVYTVSFADVSPIRSAVGTIVDSSSVLDVDKNGIISFADISAMRSNVGSQLTTIAIP
jgi:hypothetical protein